MATKAGRIQLKDIKQGRVFYQVLADFNSDGSPKIVSVKPIFVTKRPQGMRFLARRPTENHHREFFAEFHQWRDILVDLRRHFLIMQSPEIVDKGIYNPIFINKRAADRFVKQFRLRHATAAELERVRNRELMTELGIGPRGHISNFDKMFPLSNSHMFEPSSDIKEQWEASFKQPEAAKEPILTCECGQRGQYPFYLGANCHFCNTEFKDRSQESPAGLYQGLLEKVADDWVEAAKPLEFDWEGVRKAFAGIPHVTIKATLPPAPPAWGPRGEISEEDTHLFRAPVMRGYGAGITGYADMIFNPVADPDVKFINGGKYLTIQRGKHRGAPNPRTWGEVEVRELPKPVHFYKGDQLKVIDNKDGDELCEGGLAMDEIVTMMDRSSENRSHILIKRENGREYQLEKRRFELHQVGGSQGVITAFWNEDEIPLDEAGNRAEIIFDSGSTIAPLVPYGINPNFAFMEMPEPHIDPLYEAAYRAAQQAASLHPPIVVEFGKDGKPLNLYGDENSYKPFPDINQIPEDGLLTAMPISAASDWNVAIDGPALICVSHGQLSEEEYTKIRTRAENGLTDEECMVMIKTAQGKPGRPLRSSEMY